MKNIQLVEDYKDDKFNLVYAFEVDGDDVRVYEINKDEVYVVEERIRDVRDILQVGLSKSEAIRVAYEYINGHFSYPKENGEGEEKEYYGYLQEEFEEMKTKIK